MEDGLYDLRLTERTSLSAFCISWWVCCNGWEVEGLIDSIVGRRLLIPICLLSWLHIWLWLGAYMRDIHSIHWCSSHFSTRSRVKSASDVYWKISPTSISWRFWPSVAITSFLKTSVSTNPDRHYHTPQNLSHTYSLLYQFRPSQLYPAAWYSLHSSDPHEQPPYPCQKIGTSVAKIQFMWPWPQRSSWSMNLISPSASSQIPAVPMTLSLPAAVGEEF